jgi:hypothetical protein
MTRQAFPAAVECYAGYRGDETPRRFCLGARWIEVLAVLDRWLDPEHRYFKLRGDDGGLYILRHDAATDAWQMTLYRRGEAAAGGEGGGTRVSSGSS